MDVRELNEQIDSEVKAVDSLVNISLAIGTRQEKKLKGKKPLELVVRLSQSLKALVVKYHCCYALIKSEGLEAKLAYLYDKKIVELKRGGTF